MLGDFNAILNSELDRSKVSLIPRILIDFCNYIKQFWFIDIWRKVNLVKCDYTFFSNQHLTHSRIDFIMVLESLESDLSYSCTYFLTMLQYLSTGKWRKITLGIEIGN